MNKEKEVRERRLRPIYDAIDSGQYKQSIQLCTKLLKKNEDPLIVKALMGLTMQRMHKPEEAKKLADEVKAGKPTDESVLQALTLTYRALNLHGSIVEIYEVAADADPKNFELQAHLFMACARGGLYSKMQKVALRMNKATGTKLYLHWAISSILLQGKDKTNENAGMMLSLAEKMAKKAIEDNKLDELEELTLLLSILEEQGKLDEALTIVKGDLGDRIYKVDYDRKRVEMEFNIKLKRWKEIHSISKILLLNDTPDDWNLYTIHFDAIQKILEEEPSERTKLLEEGKAFIQDIIAKEKLNPRVRRGPFLSEFEFSKRFEEKPSEKIPDLVLNYFNLFGSKSCCFTDLRSYLCFIPSEKKDGLLSQLQQKADSIDLNVSAANNIRMNTCIAQIKWCIESYQHPFNTPPSEITIVDKWIEAYEKSLPYGKSLEVTELQYGDDYVLLAAHLLIYQYKLTGDRAYLLQAVALLQYGNKNSKYNFQMKLLAIRIYAILGVYNRLSEIYTSLDVKHIQQDTISFFLVDNTLNLGAFDKAIHSYAEVESFYESNRNETPEMVVLAYKHGTFSKTSEFTRFYQRIDQSIHKAVVQVEGIRHDLLFADQLPHHTEAKLNPLDACIQQLAHLDDDLLLNTEGFLKSRFDNRDFRVMIHFNGVDQRSIMLELQTEYAKNIDWYQVNTQVFKILKKVAKKDTNVLELVAELEKLVAEKEISKSEKIRAKAVILGTKIFNCKDTFSLVLFFCLIIK